MGPLRLLGEELLSADRAFVGRSFHLQLLYEQLVECRRGNRAAAIVGPPGVGKTALAYEFARRFARHFPGGVFRVEGALLLGGAPEAAAGIGSFATDGPPFLVIADGVEDAGSRRAHSLVKRIVEQYREGRIILTSREGRLFRSPLRVVLQLGVLDRPGIQELIGRRFAARPAAGEVLASAADLHSLSQGNPRAAIELATAIEEGAPLSGLRDALQPFSRPGLLGPDGMPLGEASTERGRIVSDVRQIDDRLLERLAADPTLLWKLPWRTFEDLVAELFSRLGYQVELTPASRDGGKDLYIAKRDDIGSFLYLVECKRQPPDRPVGVGVVRELFGVVEQERATAGIVATTSFFTKDARDFQRPIAFRISLRDYIGIRELIDQALRKQT